MKEPDKSSPLNDVRAQLCHWQTELIIASSTKDELRAYHCKKLIDACELIIARLAGEQGNE